MYWLHSIATSDHKLLEYIEKDCFKKEDIFGRERTGKREEIIQFKLKYQNRKKGGGEFGKMMLIMWRRKEEKILKNGNEGDRKSGKARKRT